MFHLWRRGQELGAIHVEPLLASWDRASDPSQIRLQAYLDKVELSLRPRLGEEGHYYLFIEVGLPPHVGVLRHYDLENYLTPVAHRLRDRRVRLARATKRVDGQSRVSVGQAEPYGRALLKGEWQHFSSRCKASSASKAWKEQLRDSLLRQGAAVAEAGPLEMHIASRCNAHRRNWINLWKPTGDALGPILGEPDISQPFNPHDDRIVSLDLHLEHDDSLGYEVDVEVWWRAAPPSHDR